MEGRGRREAGAKAGLSGIEHAQTGLMIIVYGFEVGVVSIEEEFLKQLVIPGMNKQAGLQRGVSVST
jgi:hypothetical protein